MVKKLLKLSMRQIWTGTKEVAMGLEKRQKRVICSAHCKMERGGPLVQGESAMKGTHIAFVLSSTVPLPQTPPTLSWCYLLFNYFLTKEEINSTLLEWVLPSLYIVQYQS